GENAVLHDRAMTLSRPSSGEPGGAVATARRLIRDYVAGQWPVLAVAILCMLVTAATNATIPLLIKYTTRYLFQMKQADMLWPITIAVVVVLGIRAISTYGQKSLVDTVGERVVA